MARSCSLGWKKRSGNAVKTLSRPVAHGQRLFWPTCRVSVSCLLLVHSICYPPSGHCKSRDLLNAPSGRNISSAFPVPLLMTTGRGEIVIARKGTHGGPFLFETRNKGGEWEEIRSIGDGHLARLTGDVCMQNLLPFSGRPGLMFLTLFGVPPPSTAILTIMSRDPDSRTSHSGCTYYTAYLLLSGSIYTPTSFDWVS